MLNQEKLKLGQIATLLQEVVDGYKAQFKELEDEIEEIRKTKESLLDVKKVIDVSLIPDPITLNIGGIKFQTSKATLTRIKGSYFDVMLSGEVDIKSTTNDKSNSFFIDRDGTHFRYILNYLRDGDSSIFPQDFRSEINRELVFYKLIESLPCPTTLIESAHVEVINNWIGTSKVRDLIYKGTRDGFLASKFHSLCDGKGETITLIKSSDGNVFGGYNSQSWNSDGEYYGDNKCFIFTIINKQGLLPTKYLPKHVAKHLVFGHAGYGPSFGSGHDIYISDQCNNNQSSYQNFPYSYEDTTGKGKATFASGYQFKVDEIETFIHINMLDQEKIKINQISTLLQEVEKGYKDEIINLENQVEVIKKTKESLEETKKVIDVSLISDPITLNIGGIKFQTSKATLTRIKASYFDVMLSGQVDIKSTTNDQSNTFFIDRDGTHFRYILNYLRDDDLSIFPQDLKSEINRELVFYKLLLPTEMDSKLIDSTQLEIIKNWIGTSKTLNLVYRGTRDGFQASKFHSLCDGKGETVTLIKSTDGNVFGGYNSQSWNTNNTFYGDNKCFIFTIINKQGLHPTKYIPSGVNSNYAVGSAGYGPVFGSSYDILISDQCNSNQSSYQNFPSTYSDTTGKGKSTLTPTYNFKVDEIEIFLHVHMCDFFIKQNSLSFNLGLITFIISTRSITTRNNNLGQIATLLQEVVDCYKAQFKELEDEIEEIRKTKESLLDVKKVIEVSLISDPITLNIGGIKFQTSKATLTRIKASYFDVMLSGQVDIKSTTNDQSNTFFVDSHLNMLDQERVKINQISTLLQEVEQGYKDELIDLENEIKDMKKKKESLEETKKAIDVSLISDPITLNIGGIKFQTSKSTLTRIKGSYFDVMLSGQVDIKSTNNDKLNSFLLIDGTHFRYILSYLRDGYLPVIPQGFKLDGTRDGFQASKFHSLCNDRGETVTLIKSSDGNVFGGYNSQSWNSDEEYSGDNKCFIFTIINKQGVEPTKYIPRQGNPVKIILKKHVPLNTILFIWAITFNLIHCSFTTMTFYFIQIDEEREEDDEGVEEDEKNEVEVINYR
ncbi:hypothetical protein DFA_07360 [Cavenderia fasciculata]|uniref:TLDc domain-containing protein n=1 Tax=Cavenderia fasciculata TaxID=261658 RepID=F4PW74_CACFS|nr:uncharacterized protein DFA_07360 [Cavenderia fasciculata]EGG20238.1 hypothetical protein DFA_07360 [Cavenderia fasciculata]|eukprot:XP_004367221.1 hypothetical protein DFA_07360 [Cavenderia fasciculata]